MSYESITATLSSSVAAIDNIDVIGYDACVAAQVEVLHTWRPFATVFSGSQDYVGWGGVDYATVIAAIDKNPLISPEELSVTISSSMLTDPDDGCASSFALNDTFDTLIQSIDSLSHALLLHLDDIRTQLVDIRERVPMVPRWPSDEFHRDLYGVAEQLSLGLSEQYPDIGSAATAVMTAFNSSLLFNGLGTGGNCDNGKGLSIYWTKSGKGRDTDYGSLSFAKATHWDEFLELF
jgi:hypothetical protein